MVHAEDIREYIKKMMKFVMDKIKKDNKRLYRFFVPFKDRHGRKIPDERRNDFINVIETESCKHNEGFTAYDARGGYAANNGEIINEDVTVIETYGKNPLPPGRLARCREYLAQESLIVAITTDYEIVNYDEHSSIPEIYRQ